MEYSKNNILETDNDPNVDVSLRDGDPKIKVILYDGGIYLFNDANITGEKWVQYPESLETLTVDTLLKLSPMFSNPVCGAEQKGTIYYNAFDNKLKVCTSTGWQNLN